MFEKNEALSLDTALRRARKAFSDAGFSTPRLDAELLLTHATGLKREAFFLAPDKRLEPLEIEKFNELVKRRLGREPVARILGEAGFWGLSFRLNEATLVPRPDTETLIEAALDFIKERGWHNEPIRLLDLGTGSGCILAALLHELPKAEGVGVDASAQAVEAARENLASLGLMSRANLYEGNWFEPVSGLFHLIVSNPPYIAKSEMESLMDEVRNHDPEAALTPGEDGLKAYKEIIGQADNWLTKNGVLILEAGIAQADAIKAIAEERGFSKITSRHDLAGVERAIVVQK